MILTIEMLGLLVPALIAGLIVASTHIPLGQEVLKRGIIFIDLAIAQIAALGAVFAHVFFHADDHTLSIFYALLFALLGGGIFAYLEKKYLKHLEAIIGSTFIISASLVILLLANDPHGGEHMQDMLAGQILWVDLYQLILTACVYIPLLTTWFFFKDEYPKTFYLIFPVAITFSVQLVGIYLVFASLIIPALGTVNLGGFKKLLIGYLIAFSAVLTGLIISAIYDLPSGPTIVCCYPVFSILLLMFCKFGTFNKGI